MADSNWEQFTDFCRRGSEQIQGELKEIDMLIQQTSSEVERYMQANTRAVTRMRQIESTFDTAPREDIRRTYETLIENQQRLFTMRGQLEKLQSDQKHLTRIGELYNRVLSFAPPEDFGYSDQAVAPQGRDPPGYGHQHHRCAGTRAPSTLTPNARRAGTVVDQPGASG